MVPARLKHTSHKDDAAVLLFNNHLYDKMYVQITCLYIFQENKGTDDYWRLEKVLYHTRNEQCTAFASCRVLLSINDIVKNWFE
jgi:hypothetical protein